jgi:hypothetical protein
MLLVVTLHPTGKIDLNSADVEMTGRAFDVLREQLHAYAEACSPERRPYPNRSGTPRWVGKAERLARWFEEKLFDHAALRAIGFTKVAIVIELEQPEPTAAELLLRNQPD